MLSNDKKKLCVVLLNYRTPELVIDCLSSLLPELSDIDAQVVVVDNNSEDDSIALISQWLVTEEYANLVKVLDSGYNGGFASGNNFGIRHIEADYYLLLNSDTLLRRNAISEMLNAMQADESLGLLGPRLEWPDSQPQESCFRYHRPLSEFIASSGTGIFLRLFPKYEVAYRVSDVAGEYEWVSFACVLIRSKVFFDVGLLDDKFFMYFEDVEFCFRAKKAGWIIRNHPAARVVHLRGGSSPVKANAIARKRQARYYYESRTRYYYKVFGRFGLFAANLLWTAGWLFSRLRSLLQRSFHSPACELEWKDIWTNFLSPERAYIHPKDY